jgi:hypothetical protein
VTKCLVSELLVPIGSFAYGKIAPFALLALAANDRKRYHHAVADFESALSARSNVDYLAHGLVAHDVPGFHSRHDVVEQMQVRTANGPAGHLDDRVALMFDPWIRNTFAADIGGSVPTLSFLSPFASVHNLRNMEWMRSFHSDAMIMRAYALGLAHASLPSRLRLANCVPRAPLASISL